jgi:hypothetical protein
VINTLLDMVFSRPSSEVLGYQMKRNWHPKIFSRPSSEVLGHLVQMLLKIPDEYPGKTNYCLKRKYIKEYFSTLRDLSQIILSRHYTTNVKIVMKNILISGTSSAFYFAFTEKSFTNYVSLR